MGRILKAIISRAGLSGLCLAAALALASCTMPVRTSDNTQSIVTAASRSERAGRLDEAAEYYLQAADRERGEASVNWRLEAVRVLLANGSAVPAGRLLHAMPVPTENNLQARYRMLEAELLLTRHQTTEAATVMRALDTPRFPRSLRRRYHELFARIWGEAGNFLEQARQGILLENWLTSPEDLRAARLSTWNAVTQLHEQPLPGAMTGGTDSLSGWYELARIARHPEHDALQLELALADWQQRFPAHPAGPEIVPLLIAGSLEQTIRPAHIGLLLPLTGTFAGPAAAVRDGIISAWYFDQDNPQRSVISVYDANVTTLWEAVYQATEDGVDFFIGPLDKESTAILGRSGHLPITTLSLNRAVADASEPGADVSAALEHPDNLYQFGLLPEDEARQVAQYAWFAGHVRAAVMVPDTPWGARLHAAFAEYWSTLGGEIVVFKRFPKDTRAISATVQELLNIDQSSQRINSLKARLDTDLHTETRRRQDIDFIFMPAFPAEARLLYPQFAFHKASDIPVYATSHVYSGTVDADSDRDMNGLYFTDTPWVLNADRPEYSLQKQIERIWPETSQAYRRLFALGVDAYHVVPHLARLRARPFSRFQGETGILSVSPDAVVQRQLTWARFAGGRAHIVDN